jgi:hypothetical protein
MNRAFSFMCVRQAVACAVLWLLAVAPAGVVFAADQASTTPPPATSNTGPTSVRSGGLLEGSFNYHRQSPVQQPPAHPAAAGATARSGGWYHYGFPVESYRWGYFGAERNYPRIMWHTGWYGDCVRTAYRYGY